MEVGDVGSNDETHSSAKKVGSISIWPVRESFHTFQMLNKKEGVENDV